MLCLLESRTRRIHGGLHLKQTWRAAGAAHGHMGTNDVAIKRDHSKPCAHCLKGLLRAHIINNHRAVQCGERTNQVFRTAYKIADLTHAKGNTGLLSLCVDEHERCSPTIRFAQNPDRTCCGFGTGDRYGISQGPECSAHRGLVARLDLQERRHRANNPGDCTLWVEECAGAIAAIKTDLQCLKSSSSGRSFTIGIRLLRAQCGECTVSQVKSLSSLFVLCIETEFAIVETSDLGLQCMELLLCFLGACARICNLDVESLNLGGARLDPRTCSSNAPDKPRHALAAISFGLLCRCDTSLFSRVSFFSSAPRSDGVGENCALALDLATEFELFGTQCAGIVLKYFGIASGWFLIEILHTHTLSSKGCRAHKTLLERCEGVPRLLRLCEQGAVLHKRVFDLLKSGLGFVLSLFDLSATLTQRSFVSNLRSKCVPHLHKIVSKQS